MFETWETTGSVTAACRKAHIGCGTFYYWKARFDSDGYAGVEEYEKKGPEKGYGRVSEQDEMQALELHEQHDDWGKHRIANEIAKANNNEAELCEILDNSDNPDDKYHLLSRMIIGLTLILDFVTMITQQLHTQHQLTIPYCRKPPD